MSCEDTRLMIHGYLDNELGLDGTIAFERHVAECPSCSLELEDYKALRGKIRDSSLYYQAPTELSVRIHHALGESSGEELTLPVEKLAKPGWWQQPTLAWAFAAFACGVLFLALTSSLWMPHLGENSHETLFAQEVLASHVRSMMADHLFDVPSSDPHTVKPWFDGKLDFSPPVPNLDSQGFVLAGGRLDYVESRPVAAVVYRRRQHVINLFMLPEARESSTKTEMRNGYNMIHWSSGGMEYWAVSDLNQQELQQFVGLVQGQTAPQPSP